MNNLKFDINDDMISIFKDTVDNYEFVKSCLQSNDIYELYNKLDETRKNYYISSTAISTITKLLYNSGIDPLDYLDEVPVHFLRMSTFSTDTPNIKIPPNIKTIGRGSFAQCNNLKQVELSTGVKSIDNVAFSHCHQLKYLVINKDIEHIGMNVFSYCGDLQDIVYLGTKEEWDKIVKDADWGKNITATSVIKCKDGNISL